jgi:multifunctional methyltransferase subunit TRM112
MRLLTHNTLRNNSESAKGKGFPLKITATEIRVDDPSTHAVDAEQQIQFCRGILSMLDWPALVAAATDMGLSTLPPILTQDLASNEAFLQALYHILLHVHLIQGMLTCPTTGREFPVANGIPNMILEEEECENVRI